MSLPSSIYGKVTDLYLATDNIITSGRLVLGQEFYDEQTGDMYRFVRANGAIPVNAACIVDPAQINKDVVIGSTAAAQYLAGVNDTGLAAASTNSFWMRTAGRCTPLVAASQAAGVKVGPSAVANTMTVDAGGHCVLLAASGAGGATAARLYL